MTKKVYRDYIDACEAYYPLMADYGDSSVVFYKTKYVTNQKPFVPKIQGNNYPALKDCLARNIQSGKMLSVFRNVNIDKSKYRLLREEVPENAEALDWYEVTETWGYTPESSFTTSVVAAWTRPAFKCELDNVITKALTDWEVQSDGSTDIACDNSDGRITVGGVVNLTSGEYEGEDSKTLIQTAESVPVIGVSEVGFKVSAFNWTIYDLNGTAQGTVESNAEGSVFKRKDIAITAEVIGSTLREMSLKETDDKNQTHVINVDNSDGRYRDGDIVVFYKDYYQSLLQIYYSQRSDYVRVLKAFSDRIIVPYFNWKTSNGSTIASDETGSGFFVPGNKWIGLRGEERLSWSADFAGTQIVDFVAEFDPKDAWTPESGRESVNYVAYYTTPTLKEYQEMISRGDMVLAQPQVYERLSGDIYKRTSVYVKCQ